MNAVKHIGSAQGNHIVVAGLLGWYVFQQFALEVVFLQMEALDHGAHGTVQNEDALAEKLLEIVVVVVWHCVVIRCV